VDGRGAYPQSDQGLIEITQKPDDMGRFRAPTLRNIGVTAPYMHDGSVESLTDAISHYAAGGRRIASGPNAGNGRESPVKDIFMVSFPITPGQRADLIEFLMSLTDESFMANPKHSDPFIP
jgi:cytochrome c peroxidase